MKINAIIMASGLSKRMTKDKLHLKINKKKIYQYILLTIRQCNFNEVILVANDEEIIKESIVSGFKTVKNNYSYLGQSFSIKLALENSSQCDGYMFFVADQPFIKVSTILHLCDVFNKNPDKIIIPLINGSNKNPVIFPSYFKKDLMVIEGDQGGRFVIRNNAEKVIKVTLQNEDEFFDIDTLDDYKKAIEMKVQS